MAILKSEDLTLNCPLPWLLWSNWRFLSVHHKEIKVFPTCISPLSEVLAMLCPVTHNQHTSISYDSCFFFLKHYLLRLGMGRSSCTTCTLPMYSDSQIPLQKSGDVACQNYLPAETVYKSKIYCPPKLMHSTHTRTVSVLQKYCSPHKSLILFR